MTTTPTVHLNGTPRERLLEQATAAMQALREAVTALQGMSPNGRDYYPQGSAVFEEAMREQREREMVLVTMHDEISAWCERVADAGTPISAPTDPARHPMRGVRDDLFNL